MQINQITRKQAHITNNETQINQQTKQTHKTTQTPQAKHKVTRKQHKATKHSHEKLASKSKYQANNPSTNNHWLNHKIQNQHTTKQPNQSAISQPKISNNKPTPTPTNQKQT